MNNDFYFIYFAIGIPFLKTIIHNFQSIPKDTNVVILTNTPNYLKDINVEFNLIVVDIESLRDDWSKKIEKIPYGETEDEYITDFKKLHDEGYRFPMQIMRYGIKWAALNNITKFVVMESGMTIGFSSTPNRSLFSITQPRLTKNIIFANTYFSGHDKGGDYLKIPYIRDIIKKWDGLLVGYDVDLDNYPETLDTERDPRYPGSIEFEGGMMGFWFHDIVPVEFTFNLYNDIMKTAYEKNHNIESMNDWAVNFEWVSTIITTILGKYFNTYISGHHEVVVHYYHPEEFYFMEHARRINGVEWIAAPTREEFIQLNRAELIHLFKGIDNAKKLCYGFN